jgi:hypothetical protein
MPPQYVKLPAVPCSIDQRGAFVITPLRALLIISNIELTLKSRTMRAVLTIWEGVVHAKRNIED